jgi:hypothetical protein
LYTDWNSDGGAVGIAYLNKFGTASTLNAYKPTFVFTKGYFYPKQVRWCHLCGAACITLGPTH